MIHLKCLAVRTLHSRHVKMNHAMQHMAATVLFAGLLLLAQSDARLPVTHSATGWWGQTHRLCGAPVPSMSAEQGSSAACQADRPILQKWTKLKRYNYYLSQFSASVSRKKISESRRSRRDICLHNHLTEHWEFKRDLYALPTHLVLPH